MIADVLGHVLGKLADENHRVFYARCADGGVRKCFIFVIGWGADYPEQATIGNLAGDVCPMCELPKNQFGSYPFPAANRRNHQEYRRLFDEGALLPGLGVRPSRNFVWDIISTPDIAKPDLLHTVQLGLLDYCLTWIHRFCDEYHRLSDFNDIWKHVPSYLSTAGPKKAYEEIGQWTGKEYRNMSRYVVAVFRATLSTPRPGTDEKHVFSRAIRSIRGLIEFSLYCQYHQHDNTTLSQMQECLHEFHRNKDIFRPYRADKKANREVEVMIQDLRQQRDRELAAPGLTVVQRDELRRLWNDDVIPQTRREERAARGEFNLPKLHMSTHFVDYVVRYGNIRQFNSAIGEKAHLKVKAGYRASNRTGDYLAQMIDWEYRNLTVSARSLALQCGDDGSKLVKGPDIDGEIDDYPVREAIRPLSYLKASPYLRGPQKIKNLRGVIEKLAIEDIIDEIHRFLDDKLKIDYDNDDILDWPASIHHQMEVSVQHFQTGKWMRQILHCTANSPWLGGKPRRDWIWWRTWNYSKTSNLRRKAPYGALKGRLPARLRGLFKLSVARQPGPAQPFEPMSLALIELVRPYQNGRIDDVSGMVKAMKIVEKRARFRVISIGAIEGAAHLIPEMPAHEPTSWWVNSHIDLETWNAVWPEPEDVILESRLDGR